jgi:RimJ/RimL family protein N-acetyltransferase
MIIIGSPFHGGLIARAAHTGYDVDVDTCLARVVGGEFLGGFIITNYNGAICMVHMAGKDARWCSPELLWALFDYCFVNLQVRRMFCTVDSANPRALQLVRRAGWRSEHRILDGTPNGDLLIFSMAADHCRWLKRHPFYRVNGSETTHAPAI